MPAQYSSSLRCRLFAAGSWAVAAGWFYFVLVGTWGFMQPSLFFWGVVAIPLAWTTRRWLIRAGRRPTGTGLLIVGPIVLLSISIALPRLATDWRHQLAWVLLYATLVISGIGVILSLSAGIPLRPATPDRGESS
jgi:hypothetical protein